ncbi:MAG: group II intron maturase-specific domain-containing protein [Steroidobacteraceae bacterium]
MQAGDAPGEIRGGVLLGRESSRTVSPATVHVPGLYVPPATSQDPQWGSLDELPACAECSGRIQRMSRTIREWHLPRQDPASLQMLAKRHNAILSGWLNYYGRFYRSAMQGLFDRFDQSLLRWARCKYRRFARHPRRARRWLRKMVNRHPRLFTHWLAFGKVTVRTMGAV